MLGVVKKEFKNFGGLLQNVQNNIQTGFNELDDVVDKRTRALQRKLKVVEALSVGEEKGLLSDVPAGDWVEEEE